MARILVVEDSQPGQYLIQRTLDKDYQLKFVSSLNEAKSLSTDDYDLILLDLSLPDGDGLAFCQSLEKQGKTRSTPVIMLTARSKTEERIEGLKTGADDYISKPFDSGELVARVESVLRRRQSKPKNDIQIGHLRINLVDQKVYIETNDKTQNIDLTPHEFKILVHLSQAAEAPVSRKELYNAVWGKDVHLSVRNIDTHVCKLRHKIGEAHIEIKSVRSQGYILRTHKNDLASIVPPLPLHESVLLPGMGGQ